MEKQRKRLQILILVEAESRSFLSTSMLVCSDSVSTVVVMNLPMWNPTIMKSGSLAKVLATHGIH
jgi:hypothetical protein